MILGKGDHFLLFCVWIAFSRDVLVDRSRSKLEKLSSCLPNWELSKRMGELQYLMSRCGCLKLVAVLDHHFSLRILSPILCSICMCYGFYSLARMKEFSRHKRASFGLLRNQYALRGAIGLNATPDAFLEFADTCFAWVLTFVLVVELLANWKNKVYRDYICFCFRLLSYLCMAPYVQEHRTCVFMAMKAYMGLYLCLLILYNNTFCFRVFKVKHCLCSKFDKCPVFKLLEGGLARCAACCFLLILQYLHSGLPGSQFMRTIVLIVYVLIFLSFRRMNWLYFGRRRAKERIKEHPYGALMLIVYTLVWIGETVTLCAVKWGPALQEILADSMTSF